VRRESAILLGLARGLAGVLPLCLGAALSNAAHAYLSLPLGSYVASRYRLVALLGQGGSGTVYHALDLEADPPLPVALKLYHLPHGEGQSQRWRRVEREAHELAKIQHPAVIRLLAAGPWLDFFFVAMELAEGETLKSRLTREARLPEPAVKALGRQVAGALEHLWQHHLVHRDVSPGNLMLGLDGTVKLLDFGIAKEPGVSSLTVQSQFFGNPYYVSPEYILGEDHLDIRGDVYSLGATLYHAASGQPPFSGSSDLELLDSHFRFHPRPVRQIRAELSPELEALLARMLSRERAGRPWPAELLTAFA
jgi:eukaryotic-like serine/threonine-protein kinase